MPVGYLIKKDAEQRLIFGNHSSVSLDREDVPRSQNRIYAVVHDFQSVNGFVRFFSNIMLWRFKVLCRFVRHWEVTQSHATICFQDCRELILGS